ncbi:MAG: DUF4258 domain-containing protein [SAR202 cluster bacterium]|nr:DUF4258 domain-containing protein [SAR202 cluster bacterium]
MDIVVSEHAKEEMARRGISRNILDEVLREPGQIVASYDGRKVYQSKFAPLGGKMYLIRVVVASDVSPPMVITAYKTSQVGKYRRDH